MKKSNRIGYTLIAGLMLCLSIALTACQYSSIQDPRIPIITEPYKPMPYCYEGVTIEGLRQTFEQSDRFQKRKVGNDVDFMKYRDRDTKAVVLISLDPPVDHVISFSLEFKIAALTEKNKPGHIELIKQVLTYVGIEIDDDTAAKVLSGSLYDDNLYVRDQTTDEKYFLYIYPASAQAYFEPVDPNLSSRIPE